jgi:hypothetical protein
VRGSGRVFHRAGSAHYWIAYYHRGREIRESSGSADRSRAERLLRQRLREVGADHLGAKPFVGPAEARVLFEVLVQTYLQGSRPRVTDPLTPGDGTAP